MRHTYLGRADDPAISLKTAGMTRNAKIPAEFNHLFWDTDPGKIDLRRNANYVIEKVLEHGRLGEMEWLAGVYPGRRILEVAETSRSVSERSRNFWKIWLGAAVSTEGGSLAS